MPDTPTSRAHTLGVILWPAFVAAVLLSLLFFVFFDPQALAQQLSPQWQPSRLAGYTLGFFLCWSATAVSSALTWLLLRPGPRPPATLDEEDQA